MVGGVSGCEVRLRRTIDLVHNIQTAHGSPQRRQLRVLSLIPRRWSAGMLHGRYLDPCSGVIRGGARGSALRGVDPARTLPSHPCNSSPDRAPGQKRPGSR